MQSPPSQEITQFQICRQAPAWSEREVLDLITCWGNVSVMAELCSKKGNASTYAIASRAMTERGYSRDTEQHRTKIKELRQAYQKVREANGCSGSQPPTFHFYRDLYAIMGDDTTTTPPLSVDTGIYFPSPSQEPILRLEPIASPHFQCGLPDHDPGEGTSGANVSAWPLFTPSQRLVQIRKWKKRTQDDKFAELMQSSCTDSPQLNAQNRHPMA
ncbi:uncharacterized protein LOC142047375 [Chelonoidis abingdonii]|uniref:uncharacterized protein LOC142047375 n=1 Tax=Chelonoidis abingdonii TaxID=106734 RepID=UPI003F49A8B7